jgi:tetratricopeptide (TPR) repeat protein
VAKDPGYARGWLALADVYSVWAAYGGDPTIVEPKSVEVAQKALALDPTLAHAYSIIGTSMMEYDWKFAEGEAVIKKGLAIDPNDATAHQWYSEELGWIGGREKEAVAEAVRAHELEPSSAIIEDTVCEVKVNVGDFDGAIEECKRGAAQFPEFAKIHDILASAYYAKGMYPQMIEEEKIYYRLSGDEQGTERTAALEQGFRTGGIKAGIAKELEVIKKQGKNSGLDAFTVATLYAQVNEKEEAFAQLNMSYQRHEPAMESLMTSYGIGPLRSDPRYAELVRKVGLPQAKQ